MLVTLCHAMVSRYDTKSTSNKRKIDTLDYTKFKTEFQMIPPKK